MQGGACPPSSLTDAPEVPIIRPTMASDFLLEIGAEEIPGVGPWMGRVLFDGAVEAAGGMIIGRFATAAACLNATNDKLLEIGLTVRSGVECGRDCVIIDQSDGSWKCAETRR